MAPSTDEPDLLRVEDVHVHLDSAHILQGASLKLHKGVCGIVGRNGMGKSTLVRSIMGLVPISSGRITWRGASLNRLPTHQIARQGIGYVPQGRGIFASLSVHEHLTMAARKNGNGRWTPETVYELFPRLAQRRRHGGASLSGGEQQMLAIGRALVTNPALLVMDEPSEGLSPVILEHLLGTCRVLLETEMSILLVEQNLHFISALVPGELLVMLSGRIAAAVSGRQLMEDQNLRARMLGVAIQT